MAQAVNTEQLRVALQRDPNLPTLPDHVQKILALLRDPNVPFPVLAREIQKDPAIALRIVRMANSAAYGQSREVSSLDRAFAVIGLAQVPPLLAGLASVERCERFLGDQGFNWQDFWGHCSGTAFIAATLARRLERDFQGAEFLGGLLHDIGYLALAKYDPARFDGAVAEAASRHGFLSRFLEEGFGLRPADAGAVLAEVSELAPELREVIVHHANPREAPGAVRDLVSTVSLANELAHLSGITFYRGSAEVEVVIPELPAWQLLAASHPEMAGWDLALLVFELEREYAASNDFVRETRSN